MDALRRLLFQFRTVLRRKQRERDLEDELRFHIEAETEEHLEGGVPADEARFAAARSLGSPARIQEQTRAIWTWLWWDHLAKDVRYAGRQLTKSKLTSAAAILSLALAIGACMAAFRLIDALLLRPLPISDPERLYVVTRHGPGFDGKPRVGDSCSYPLFEEMRVALRGKAELLAVSYSERVDLTYASQHEMEKAHRQYVSGSLFDSFGVTPALGRVFSAADDRTVGAHPYAVLSHDYWTRRFGSDPNVLGRKLRMGNDVLEIVGVSREGFFGTEPGTMVDVFIPVMMKSATTLRSPNSFWFLALVRPDPGTAVGPLEAKLHAIYRTHEQERSKSFTNFPKHLLKDYPRDQIVLERAAAGVSGIQRTYRLGLTALAILVVLVLLIACVNVANLMLARAAARAREMSLRVSLGAGRTRLVQLVLIESACMAFLAMAAGTAFAWWAAPFVVSLINPPDNPARLVLTSDWRVLGFALVLVLTVTVLFGLLPALRASGVKPAGALKGGVDPHARGRLMRGLIAVQVAFCFLVHFAGNMFIASYDRLANQPTGFSSERVLVLETVTAQPQLPVFWNEVGDRLRSVPGVEAVAISEWPLMSGEMRNRFISVNGAAPGDALAYELRVSPGWAETMKIQLLAGRDFHAGDVHPAVAVVNQTFARTYFNGDNPVGKSFEIPQSDGKRVRFEIIGMVSDARYSGMREPIFPIAYMPFPSVDQNGIPQPGGRGTFVVRTVDNDPSTLAAVLRKEVTNARSEFRVSNVRTQAELVARHTVRERLLATLALFFSIVALVLAAVGLFGVLDYSVLQRRREIGIRLALGAPAGNVVAKIGAEAFAMVLLGTVAGLATGMLSERYIATLLFQVNATDPRVLMVPVLTIFLAALLAALPPLVRAVRVDPVKTLRAE